MHLHPAPRFITNHVSTFLTLLQNQNTRAYLLMLYYYLDRKAAWLLNYIQHIASYL